MYYVTYAMLFGKSKYFYCCFDHGMLPFDVTLDSTCQSPCCYYVISGSMSYFTLLAFISFALSLIMTY